jgi:hypothetical protein
MNEPLSYEASDLDELLALRITCANNHRPDYINGGCQCGAKGLDEWAEHLINELDAIRMRPQSRLPKSLD